MTRLRKALFFFLGNFANITTFYVVNHFYGLTPALVASTAVSVGEIAYKLLSRQPITTLFVFTSTMTFAFGLVDLYFQQIVLFKYEACVSSTFAGIFFGMSLFTRKTVLQDMREAQAPGRPMTPDRVVYLRLLTGVWTLYFFAKAAVYLALAERLTLEEGLAARALIGTTSLYVMIGLSIGGSKFLFPFLKERGWLPPENSPNP